VRARLLRSLAHVLRVFFQVVVLAHALGFGARALGTVLDGPGSAPRRLARHTRTFLDALAYLVLLVQLARLAPRGIAPLVKPVTVVSHNCSSKG
jgi:hypothetical protein